jgi:hypothetical protein
MMVEVSPTGGTPEAQEPNPDDSAGVMQQLLNARFKTLGELKNALTGILGKDQGMKVYNQLLQMIGMTMIAPLQKASQDAADAAKKMNETSS